MRTYTATLSFPSGGLGVEPTVYPYPGQNFKLGEKVDAQIRCGGQTHTAGSTAIAILSAFGNVTGGVVRSSNHVATALVRANLSGIGTYDVSVSFLEPIITLETLGHNLDVASAVIVNGLPWDFASFDQAINRAKSPPSYGGGYTIGYDFHRVERRDRGRGVPLLHGECEERRR